MLVKMAKQLTPTTKRFCISHHCKLVRFEPVISCTCHTHVQYFPLHVKEMPSWSDSQVLTPQGVYKCQRNKGHKLSKARPTREARWGPKYILAASAPIFAFWKRISQFLLRLETPPQFHQTDQRTRPMNHNWNVQSQDFLNTFEQRVIQKGGTLIQGETY